MFLPEPKCPIIPEAPDFRAIQGGAVVVENTDFKRMQRKVQENRRRMAEGDLPTLEELNEVPSDFYPREHTLLKNFFR